MILIPHLIPCFLVVPRSPLSSISTFGSVSPLFCCCCSPLLLTPSERQQEEEAVRHEEYVLADQDLRVAAGWRTITAPQERPGERRSAEMKRLYGENAARIQAMETAMQLNFDRNQDRIQPKYWPVIPLKL